jgi:UTP:GlnB (protein PII) uridylyltransferase
MVYSLLSVETADRPGLLLEIMKVISDSSVYVDSAEIDTEVRLLPPFLIL